MSSIRGPHEAATIARDIIRGVIATRTIAMTHEIVGGTGTVAVMGAGIEIAGRHHAGIHYREVRQALILNRGT